MREKFLVYDIFGYDYNYVLYYNIIIIGLKMIISYN